MRKKGFSIIFIIPVIILVLAIGGVFAYKLYSDGVKAKAAEAPTVRVLPGLQNSAGKPKSGYAGLPDPTRTPTPTIPVTITPMDVQDALKVIENDTGKNDFDNLDKESAKL